MPLPTKELTWQYNINQTCSAGPTADFTHKQMWYNIKTALTTFSSSPWEVVSSCDGATYGAGDNWVSTGSINKQGTFSNYNQHSWIVLKQTGVASNFQVCFDVGEYALQFRMFVVVSNQDGFTGGSTTTRPTATDEHVLFNWPGGSFPFSTTSPFQSVTHVQQSTDGSATRIFFMYGSQCPSWIMFQKVTDAPAAWNPACIYVAQTTDNGSATMLTYNNYYQSANIAARITGTNLPLFLTSEGMVDGAIGEYYNTPNELDNTYPLTPIGVANTSTAGKRGRHGRLKDIWWGQASTPPAYVGATYPSDGSKQFIQIGHLVFPWNGVTPIVG